MAHAKWIDEARLAEINAGNADLIPAVNKRSDRDFRPARTMITDFERYLLHDVPNVNYNFELIHDWYAAQDPEYTPIVIRAQQTPIDWKSKIGNSDMSMNFKTDYTEQILKGDYVVRQDGKVYLLNWNVTNHYNNQATQTVECNDYLTFTREYHAPVDEYGYAVTDFSDVPLDEDGREIIAEEIPASHSEYAGRPEYTVSQNQPGIVANNLINIYVQWNSCTQEINIDDTVKIGKATYIIQNVYTAEVDVNKDYGCLYMQARRLPGGGLKNGV